jgi:hypothetical protein
MADDKPNDRITDLAASERSRKRLAQSGLNRFQMLNFRQFY